MVYAIEGSWRGLNPNNTSFYFDGEQAELERFQHLLTARTLAAVDQALIPQDTAEMLISHVNSSSMHIDGPDETAFLEVLDKGADLDRARLGSIVLAGARGQLDAASVATEARLLRAERNVIGYGNEFNYLTAEGHRAHMGDEDRSLYLALAVRETIVGRYGSKNPVLEVADDLGADYFVYTQQLQIADRHTHPRLVNGKEEVITVGKVEGRRNNKAFHGLARVAEPHEIDHDERDLPGAIMVAAPKPTL